MTTQSSSQPVPKESQPGPGFDVPVTTFTLANGLTVMVSENHDVPLVSLQLIYQVGSRDEPRGKTGFAHLFEHLMFEGSEHAPGSFLDNMMRAGATNINAYTGIDNTTYHATVPVGSLDYALFMESDRMGHFYATINQQSLDQQRRVVLNEKLETESGPYGKLYEQLSKGCFPADHPYAHPVIGEKEDLTAATLEDVQHWFRTYYTPSNAVLALCGAIDVASAREKVTRWFGDIPSGPPLARATTWIAPVPPQRRDRYQAKVANGSLMLAWNIPPSGHPDNILLSLVADYLASGITSLLVKKLVFTESLASGVHAYIVDARLSGQLIVTATAVEGLPLARLEARLLEEIAAFIRDGCDEAMLQQVKHDTLFNFREANKTSAQIAALLAGCYVALGDASGYQRLLTETAQASVEAIRQATDRWLTRAHFTLELEPFLAQAEIQTEGADRSHPPAILPPEPLRLPATQHAQLDNGIRVVLLERHSRNDLCLDLLLPKIPQPDAGQQQLLLAMLNQAGAGDRDAFEFDRACNQSGSRIRLQTRLHHLSLLLSCGSAQLSEALPLLCDRLQQSTLTEDAFLRQRALLLDALTEQQHVGSALALRVLPGVMYPTGHPGRVAIGVEGTPQSLKNTTLDDLRATLPALLNSAGATLVVTGATTLAQLLPALNQTLGRIASRPRAPVAAVKASAPQHPRLFLLDTPGAGQSSIVAASLLPGVSDGNEASFELLNTLFASGFTSRINLNLREAKNWTYGVKGQLINDPQQRVHYVQTEVQTDRTCEAIEEILAEFTALTGERPVTGQELDEVRTTHLLSFSGAVESLEGLNNMISWRVRNQLPDDFWLHHQQQIAAASTEQINALAQRLFSPQRLTWIVAGDAALLQQPLARLFPGELQIITDAGDSLYD